MLGQESAGFAYRELKWSAMLTLKQPRLGADSCVSGSPFQFYR